VSSVQLSSAYRIAAPIAPFDLGQLRCPARRLPEVRREDAFRCDLVIAEEPMRRLELCIIQRLGEALAWPLRKPVGEPPEPPSQPCIAEIGGG
jgi:hypothetical protein